MSCWPMQDLGPGTGTSPPSAKTCSAVNIGVGVASVEFVASVGSAAVASAASVAAASVAVASVASAAIGVSSATVIGSSPLPSPLPFELAAVIFV